MTNNDTGGVWSTYDFKWIENLGAQIIQEIENTCDSTTLQKYSGQYTARLLTKDHPGPGQGPWGS